MAKIYDIICFGIFVALIIILVIFAVREECHETLTTTQQGLRGLYLPGEAIPAEQPFRNVDYVADMGLVE